MKNFIFCKTIGSIVLIVFASIVLGGSSVFATTTIVSPSDSYISPIFSSITVNLNSVLNVIGSIVNPTTDQPVVINDDLSVTNATPSLRKGIMLQAADRPMLTNGWDPFITATNTYKYDGIGRWGIFMEPFRLTFGIATPGTNGINDVTRYFAFKKFAGDPGTGAVAAGTDLMRLSSDSVLDVLGSIKNTTQTGTCPSASQAYNTCQVYPVLVDDALTVSGNANIQDLSFGLSVTGAANVGGSLTVSSSDSSFFSPHATSANITNLSATAITGGTYTGGIGASNFGTKSSTVSLTPSNVSSLNVQCPPLGGLSVPYWSSPISCHLSSANSAIRVLSAYMDTPYNYTNYCHFSIYNSSTSAVSVTGYATCVYNGY